MENSKSNYTIILERLLKACKKEDYYGYNKHDALLSPLLNTIFGWSRLGRLFAIQSVMRFPWNIRPNLLIKKSINPKGIGLIAYSNLIAAKIFKNQNFSEEAEKLLSWLQRNVSKSFPGISWGYQYPWQDIGFFAPTHFSNRVVTCWIGFAFYYAYKFLKKDKYLLVCKDICKFLQESPARIRDTKDELLFSYVPDPSVTWAVIDVSALCAKMFALTGSALGDNSLLEDAQRCVQYLINRQTSYGAWFYTDPPKDSHIIHDNYHTGIVLDCLLTCCAICKDLPVEKVYFKGLRYYSKNLFLSNGAPKWMNNKIYPFDIHGAAQGIITFSQAAVKYPEYYNQAEQILKWTLNNLYDTFNNQFWYQKNRFYTKRFTLMRWCNAWMAYALASFLNLNKE